MSLNGVRRAAIVLMLLVLGMWAQSSVQAQTKIKSFAPAFGPVGTTVVLAGTGFTGADAVFLADTSLSFHVDSDVQITVTVPAGAKTGRFAVRVGGTKYFSVPLFVVGTSIPAP